MALTTPSKLGYVSFSLSINEATCNSLIGIVNHLMVQGCTEIHLLITTGGGSVSHGFAIFNTLRGFPIKLVTHNVGNIDSIGNVVFLAGAERFACPESTFMFHGVSWGVEGSSVIGPKARELLNNIESDERRIADVVAKETSLHADQVLKYFRDPVTENAEFAKKNGIVNDIADVQIPPGALFLVVS